MLEANRTANAYPAHPSLTPHAVKALLQYSALRLDDDLGVTSDTLRQGAGALNVGGAIDLAKAVDTSAPVGSWWLTSGVNTFTTIDGPAPAGAQHIACGRDTVLRSTA